MSDLFKLSSQHLYVLFRTYAFKTKETFIVNTDIENLIWTMGEYEPSEDELQQITDYLIERFATFLNQEIQIYNTSITSRRSATYFIYSGSQDSIFKMEWEAVVTVQLIDGKPWIDTQLLLFSQQQRLGLQKHEGNSVLIFVYERDIDSKKGEWQFLEWEKDIYGEWESYTKLSKPSTKLRLIRPNN